MFLNLTYLSFISRKESRSWIEWWACSRYRHCWTINSWWTRRTDASRKSRKHRMVTLKLLRIPIHTFLKPEDKCMIFVGRWFWDWWFQTFFLLSCYIISDFLWSGHICNTYFMNSTLSTKFELLFWGQSKYAFMNTFLLSSSLDEVLTDMCKPTF